MNILNMIPNNPKKQASKEEERLVREFQKNKSILLDFAKHEGFTHLMQYLKGQMLNCEAVFEKGIEEGYCQYMQGRYGEIKQMIRLLESYKVDIQ